MQEKEYKHRISDEQKQRAKQADLATYLLSIGVSLIPSGTRWRHPEHDSLVFTRNMYYWNSGKGGEKPDGDALDYLTKYMNMDFITAVTELTKETAKTVEITPPKVEQFSFADISHAPDMRRTIAYLNKTRGIDYTLIKKLIAEKMIFQEAQTNNIIFPIYDEKNNIVGAEVQGTLSEKRFKKVETGGKYGYGYNVNPSHSETIDYMLFFESALDVLSFWDIKQSENKNLHNCLLVSMAGLKENILEQMLVSFNNPTAFLCVDNDDAGKNFIKAVTAQIQGVRIYLPSSEHKDWNEWLKAIKGIKS